MTSNLFKIRYLPNGDGSESTTALTNADTAFVHTYLGDDNTGDGTREKPYKSANKASQKSGVTYIVFRGLINEYFNIGTKMLVGDDINQTLISRNYRPVCSQAQNVTFDTFPSTGKYISYSKLIVNDKLNLGTVLDSVSTMYNTLIKGTIPFTGSGSQQAAMSYRNSTLHIFSFAGGRSTDIKNNIVVSRLYPNAVTSIRYSVFLNIIGLSIIPLYTDDSVYNVTLLKLSLINFGYTKNDVEKFIPKDSFDNETCKVIKEQRAGGTHPNVFNKYEPNLTGTLKAAVTTGAKTSIRLITDQPANKWPTTGDVFMPTEVDYTANGVTMPAGSFEVWTYTSATINGANDITLIGASYTFKTAHSNLTKTCTRYGDVLDFTLNPDPLNEALWASDTGGYVGCFRPAYDNLLGNRTTILNVDENGISQGAGDLMTIVNDEVTFNPASTQKWNRFADKVTKVIPLGSVFKGLNAMSTDGSPWGHYIGKHQDLIDTPKIYAGETLTGGNWYKIFNDTNGGVEAAIFYNAIQYLPNYTFYCAGTVTTFSELNLGSGTYVRAIKAGVLESIEIIPYDDLTKLSATVPRFSAPLMDDVKLIYYTPQGATRYDKTLNQPVLFSHLSESNFITDFGVIEDKIAYYDNWAVSNADQEFFKLTNPSLSATLREYFTTSIPALSHLRREINMHFDEPYDY